MKRLIVTLGALALLWGAPGAQAQSGPPAAPSPGQVALVDRYFQVMHLDEQMQQSVKQTMPILIGGMMKNIPDSTVKTNLVEVLNEVMPTYTTKIVAMMKATLASVYSSEELQAMIDFYGTPLGQSIAGKSNAFSLAFAQSISAVVPEMQADLVTRLCAKMACPDNLKAQFRTPS